MIIEEARKQIAWIIWTAKWPHLPFSYKGIMDNTSWIRERASCFVAADQILSLPFITVVDRMEGCK